MRRLITLLLLCAVSLPDTAAAQGEDVIRFEPTPTLTAYRSKHYRIFTNLSQRQTVPFGRHMDAIYEQYDKRFRGLGTRQVDRMPLYLFATEQQYDRFLAEHDIDGAHSGGMFFVTHNIEGLATWADPGARQKTLEVLQHEGFHQFAWHAFGPRLPVWLNEGLAQYYESAVITGGRMLLGMTSTPCILKLKQAIRSGQTRSLQSLMDVSAEEWGQTLRKDPDHASLLYAQAWSFTYYLIHADGGRHKPQLLDYLKRLGQGERARDAEFMAFGPDGLATLESAWKVFALNQKPDEVTEATDRLTFLGTGLRVLAEHGEDMPDDLESLRSTLRRHGFRLRRSELGVTRDLSADNAAMFRYLRADRGERDFVMLDPDQNDLPPRITAPGLEPQPTLIWYRDSDGKLVQDIVYE